MLVTWAHDTSVGRQYPTRALFEISQKALIEAISMPQRSTWTAEARVL
jgi:hypothetical protein